MYIFSCRVGCDDTIARGSEVDPSVEMMTGADNDDDGINVNVMVLFKAVVVVEITAGFADNSSTG